jgi:hypothetical protein
MYAAQKIITVDSLIQSNSAVFYVKKMATAFSMVILNLIVPNYYLR